MEKVSKRKVGIVIVVVILLGILIWQITSRVTSAEPLSQSDAEKMVQDLYSGEIVEINLVNHIYEIKLELDTGIYEIKINRNTGDVEGIVRSDSEGEHVKELTEEEIKTIVLKQQDGDIKNIEKKVEEDNVVYDVMIKQENTKTNYKINAVTGEILSTNRIENKPLVETAKRLTEEEAKAIALKAVNGEVDDIDFEESNGLTYYLVEVERIDEQEATVQINAITGEVMTITWDD